jgi:uncharacterized protein (DUF924 family)
MYSEKQPQAILDFWFGNSDSETYGKPQQNWFIKNKNFDNQIRNNFLTHYEEALNNNLNHWQENALGCLALIIILDQFPRNMFRDTPQAFATDNLALNIAKSAIKNEFDQQLLPVFRWFIYLPFEHSENIEDQNLSVKLFSTLKDDPDSKSTIEYAIAHQKIIERFGRFPHRNSILARESTPEELQFLSQPRSSF